MLDRFDPPLAPLTRCVACNGWVMPVAKADILDRLRAGTARTYEEFSQCVGCGRVYWRGAHALRIDALVIEGVRRSGTGPLP